MYQTRKFTRAALSLAALVGVSGLAIPHYVAATPINNVFLQGNEFNDTANVYEAPLVMGSPTTLTTESWSYTCPTVTCTGYGLSGGGSSKADAGALGVESYVSVSGTPPAYSSLGTGNSAELDDNLTITGGNGPGILSLNFVIDGSVQNSGGMNFGNGLLYISDSSNPSGVYSSLNGGEWSLNSAVVFGGRFGSSNVTANFLLPFTYGTPFSFSRNLTSASEFTWIFDAIPYTATTDFYNTATLTSALVYDGTASSNGVTGSPVNDASILSEDGFSYGPDGLGVRSTAVPEPGELPWFVLGLGFLGLMIARRRFSLRRRFPR